MSQTDRGFICEIDYTDSASGVMKMRMKKSVKDNDTKRVTS